jgi:23S rRNA pseudouridine1911/1915/1917 synthase
MQVEPQVRAAAVRTEILTDAAGAGQRLDRALALHLPSLSRTRLKRLIEEGQVTLGGVVLRDPSFRVREGQSFVVIVPDAEIAAPAAQSMALDIRFEDAHLVVLDKPAGLVVHPAPGNPDGTLVNALLAHCGDSLSGIGGVRRPGIVHRLDKDTSGLMVVAKTETAHHALTRDFAARTIERAYQAVVWGVPAPAAGEIAGAIGRSPKNRKKMAVVTGRGGKPALTRYRTVHAFGTLAALLECRLATGRTHQIRVHLAERQHPVIGDPTYGARGGRRLAATPQSATAQAERIRAFPRQALHAGRLGFVHPATGEQLVFDSVIPPDMQELLANLERL